MKKAGGRQGIGAGNGGKNAYNGEGRRIQMRGRIRGPGFAFFSDLSDLKGQLGSRPSQIGGGAMSIKMKSLTLLGFASFFATLGVSNRAWALDIETDIREFVIENADANTRELRELEDEVVKEQRETRRGLTRFEKSELKEELKKLNTQKKAIEDLQKETQLLSASPRFYSDLQSQVERFLNDSDKGTPAADAILEMMVAAKDPAKPGAAAGLKSAQQSLTQKVGGKFENDQWVSEGVPVGEKGLKIQTVMSFDPNASVDKKVKIEFRVAVDSQKIKNSKNPDVAKLGQAEIDELNEMLREESIVGPKIYLANGSDSSTLKSEFAKLSKPTQRTALRQDAASRFERISNDVLGKPDERGTKIGDVSTKVTRGSSDLSDEKKAVQLKLKVVDWLKKNSAKGKDPCEVIVAAVAGKFSELDSKTQAECAAFNPEVKQKLKADMDKKFSDLAQKQDAERAKEKAEHDKKFASMMADVQQLQVFCEGYRKAEAIKAQTMGFAAPIEKLYDAMVNTGATSSMFAQLCSPLGDQSADTSAVLFGAENAGDYTGQAAQIALDYPNNERGNRDLLDERTRLERIVRGSFAALEKGGAIRASAQAQMGFINPQQIMMEMAAKAQATGASQAAIQKNTAEIAKLDSETQAIIGAAEMKFGRLSQYHNCALAGLQAINTELANRQAESGSRFGGGAGAAQRANVPVVGGGAGADPNRRSFSGQNAGQRPGQTGGNRAVPNAPSAPGNQQGGSVNRSRYMR